MTYNNYNDNIYIGHKQYTHISIIAVFGNEEDKMGNYISEERKDYKGRYYIIKNIETQLLEADATKYLKYKRNMNLSPNTLDSIAKRIRYYLDYLYEEKINIYDVYKMPFLMQLEHYNDYLFWLLNGNHSEKGKRLLNNTCNTYLYTVLNFMIFTADVKGIDNGIKVVKYVDRPYVDKRGFRRTQSSIKYEGCFPANEHTSRSATRDDVETLINACNNIRDVVLLAFLGETGFRIGETLGTDYILDVEYDKMQVKVVFRDYNDNNARAKNAEERYTYLSKGTGKLLIKYLTDTAAIRGDTHSLFITLKGKNTGKSMKVRAVYALFDRLEKKTGIKCTPHMLRHYFANERRRMKWDLYAIMKALGHKHIETTIAYLGISEEEVKEAYRIYYEKTMDLYDINKLIYGESK